MAAILKNKMAEMTHKGKKMFGIVSELRYFTYNEIIVHTYAFKPFLFNISKVYKA